MGDLTWLPPILASLFGGGGVVVVWELWARPRMERKSLRAALAAEILHAYRYIESHLDQRRRRPENRVPPDFRIATTLYGALAARLGELPTVELFMLVPLYRQFEELNRIPAVYADHKAAARGTDAVTSALANQEAERSVDAFYALLETVGLHAGKVLRALPGQRRMAPPETDRLTNG